eukprot:m.212281 g.212281  ORF g.212281 m.212281 type:complete len:380 (-) comp15849_c1_seq1:60-1199(-)
MRVTLYFVLAVTHTSILAENKSIDDIKIYERRDDEARNCWANCVIDQGECIKFSGKFSCVCLPGYRGEYCSELFCLSNCSSNGVCIRSGDPKIGGLCQCFPSYTGDICNQVASASEGEGKRSKSELVLLVVFLSLVLVLIVLVLINWKKTGKTTIIQHPPVPDGSLGPIISRVVTTKSSFMGCVGTTIRREDFFDNGGQFHIPSRAQSIRDPSLPQYSERPPNSIPDSDAPVCDLRRNSGRSSSQISIQLGDMTFPMSEDEDTDDSSVSEPPVYTEQDLSPPPTPSCRTPQSISRHNSTSSRLSLMSPCDSSSQLLPPTPPQDSRPESTPPPGRLPLPQMRATRRVSPLFPSENSLPFSVDRSQRQTRGPIRVRPEQTH